EGIGRARADDRIAPGVEPASRDRAVVDGPGASFPGAPDGHETDPADAAHPGLERADRHAGGDRGIDRIAAAAQDLRADLGGPAILRHHDALAAHRLLGDLPLRRQRLAHLHLPLFPGTVAVPDFATNPARLRRGRATEDSGRDGTEPDRPAGAGN